LREVRAVTDEDFSDVFSGLQDFRDRWEKQRQDPQARPKK
jgi:hypothetical protein